jgi:galactokinase
VTFFAVNSMVKHALAGSAYQQRVAECREAVERIGQQHPHVSSLRDVTPELFATAEDQLPELIARRARHIVTEIARVGEFVGASEQGDLTLMGALMVRSHRSLQHDYEVSCAELDFLVDEALKIEGVLGARMTGGGFGGCTVNVLRPETAARFREEITSAYQVKFGVTPMVYPCEPSAGAGEVKNLETIPAAA